MIIKKIKLTIKNPKMVSFVQALLPYFLLNVLKKGMGYYPILVISTLVSCVFSSESNFAHNGVTAHRGNSEDFPENTIPAFKSALSLGVDWIELDIFKTKDGQIVVTHDANTSRVSDTDLQIEEKSYEALKSIDVAHDFRIRKKLSLKECPPESMPLLSEIIHLIMEQNKTRLSIQPKSNCVKEAIDIIKKLNAEAWVGFNDGSLSKMKEVKKEVNTIPVFWDRPADSDIDEDIKIALKEGFESIVINQVGVTKAKVDKVHKAGIEAGAWTVNDPETMKTLLGMGVDRIYTDDPRALFKILEEK
ncbi:Glycerophosphoryl diester phosphodiesterase [Cyclobacterium qasimii M12-11B]|uniref:Glycerophosphoryl diester phosphodiesterase n=3 Tax=Cyclobacterium qasimii TaxID=1350429 RepID=S7WUW0_9BACT|nr:Glycerophosphoryl diester phosphodiesterase [Cyclobacterium qasimii M12-11B]GEO23093.1 hypothetical protein CQA01_36270 [Cyclobacterium qasimii]